MIKPTEPPSGMISSDSDQGMLDEVLNRARRMTDSDVEYYLLDELQRDQKAKAALRKCLGKMGIRGPLKFVDAGSYAIAFLTSNHQIVRLSHAEKEPHSPDMPPTVLKPLVSYDLGKIDPAMHYMRMDIMPEVQIEGETIISRDEIINLIKDTACYSHLFFDPDTANVGRLKDGTLVILDLGSVKRFDDAMKDGSFDHQRLVNYMGMDEQARIHNLIAARSTLPEHDYISSQADHIEKLGLESGKLSGTIPASRIDELRGLLKAVDRDSTFTHAILAGRHDTASWQALIEQGAELIRGGADDQQWLDFIKSGSAKKGVEPKK